jgi:hypothetical protein
MGCGEDALRCHFFGGGYHSRLRGNDGGVVFGLSRFGVRAPTWLHRLFIFNTDAPAAGLTFFASPKESKPRKATLPGAGVTLINENFSRMNMLGKTRFNF